MISLLYVLTFIIRTIHILLDSPYNFVKFLIEKIIDKNGFIKKIAHMKEIGRLFDDKTIVEKIQIKLPKLFYLAELESSRAGKIGMEVGTIREKIISALLLYVFSEENVKTEIPITEPEIDVILYGTSISIKTISG